MLNTQTQTRDFWDNSEKIQTGLGEVQAWVRLTFTSSPAISCFSGFCPPHLAWKFDLNRTLVTKKPISWQSVTEEGAKKETIYHMNFSFWKKPTLHAVGSRLFWICLQISPSRSMIYESWVWKVRCEAHSGMAGGQMMLLWISDRKYSQSDPPSRSGLQGGFAMFIGIRISNKITTIAMFHSHYKHSNTLSFTPRPYTTYRVIFSLVPPLKF